MATRMHDDAPAQYLASRTWTAGMLTDLGGALLMIVAFAQAPVSVVQPVSAVGLVVLLIFSHFYLQVQGKRRVERKNGWQRGRGYQEMPTAPHITPQKERLRPQEWAAACVAFLGVLGLGLSSEPDHLDHPVAPAAQIVISFLMLVATLGE